MSSENKLELDRLLREAWDLYSRFRLLGMSQVAVPYMGDLVTTLRNLPRDPKLGDMSKGLRDAVKTGERLLDENTAWWEWKDRSETKGLHDATVAAKKLADDVDDIARANATATPGANMDTARKTLLDLMWEHMRSPATLVKTSPGIALRDAFVKRVSAIYIEAAKLYGIQETKAAARAEAIDEARKGPERAASSLTWALIVAGAGYFGIRLLTREKTIIIQNQAPAYHPGDGIPTSNHNEYESEDSHGIR
jgi:hypothetical protein